MAASEYPPEESPTHIDPVSGVYMGRLGDDKQREEKVTKENMLGHKHLERDKERKCSHSSLTVKP